MKKILRILFVLALFIITSCDGKIDENSYRENGDLDDSFLELTEDEEVEDNKELTPEQKFQKEKEILILEGWEEDEVDNGQMPDCYNFKAQRSEINNYLDVTVGGGTDVVIKLINYSTDKCIRYVFVNRNSYYKIKYIPEGKYYLKIAYGKEWLSKVENGMCIGKFIRNPLYEKGEDILNFNLKHSVGGYQIPSYSLELDVISDRLSNSFNSENISEDEFNK